MSSALRPDRLVGKVAIDLMSWKSWAASYAVGFVIFCHTSAAAAIPLSTDITVLLTFALGSR